MLHMFDSQWNYRINSLLHVGQVPGIAPVKDVTVGTPTIIASANDKQ